MDEKQILQRKIVLKNQAIKIFRIERKALERRLDLMTIKEHLEGQMEDAFNPSLSRNLDCIQALLDAEKEDGPRG